MTVHYSDPEPQHEASRARGGMKLVRAHARGLLLRALVFGAVLISVIRYAGRERISREGLGLSALLVISATLAFLSFR